MKELRNEIIFLPAASRQKPEARSQKPEARSQKPEANCQKPVTSRPTISPSNLKIPS